MEMGEATTSSADFNYVNYDGVLGLGSYCTSWLGVRVTSGFNHKYIGTWSDQSDSTYADSVIHGPTTKLFFATTYLD